MSDRAIPAIVTVCGKSDSGKTTFLEKLIAELTARGWRVATVKHHAHSDESVDIVGKDSWRHRQAGAAMSVVSSATQIERVVELEQELTLLEVVETQIGDAVDLVLAEGFKRQACNPIEVSRLERSDSGILEPAEALAFVTDNPELPTGAAPVFGLEDAVAVADLIEARLLGGARNGD